MTYDRYMDKQCIPLCDAINSIPGLETACSCCGHNKEPFQIWFHLSDRRKIRFLTIISRVFDRRYGGIIGWSCYLDNNDTPKHCPPFRIDSGNIKGTRAFQHSIKIAKNIYEHLRHPAFNKAFLNRIPKSQNI